MKEHRIDFMCLDNKELDVMLKTCHMIALHFPQNAIYFIISSSVQIMFRSFINHVMWNLNTDSVAWRLNRVANQVSSFWNLNCF